jgi:acyl-CoA synthetase (AMP-forming)/AMP-acid ligase II
MNIVDNILHQCRNHAPVVAMGAPGTSLPVVSYGRLERFIHNVSRKAVGCGLSRGQIVAIFVMDPVLHAALVLGLTRLGVITLSGRNPRLPRELDIAALMTDTDFPYEVTKIIRVDQGWLAGDGTPPADARLHQSGDDDICRIVLTSGTTGDAKAVALTHRMMAARVVRHDTVFGNLLPPCSRTYCDLGMATSLGFQFLIYMLWRGGTIFFPGATLELAVQAFTAYGVQNMISAPAGLAQLLQFYQVRKSLQCNLDMVLSAGSLLSNALSFRVRARICPNVVSLYGSTEASMIAVAPAHALAHQPGAVGYVLPDVSVEIADAAGKALPAGAEGLVRIRSPYGPGRYLGTPSDQSTAFADGWFYPGDIGRLTPDRLLVITGREKAVMNLGGDKVKPEMVEEVIASFPGIDQAAVFSVVNELGIDEMWSLIAPLAKRNEQALRAHCQAKLPATFVPVRFIAVQDLPRNAMGKVERQRLPDIARASLH